MNTNTTSSNLISNTIKLISEKSNHLQNFQRLSFNSTSSSTNPTTSIEDMAIQITTLQPDTLIHLLNKHEKLRTDFFKFEIYKEIEKKPTLIDVLLNVSSNTSDFYFFIDYLLSSRRLDLLHCLVENCKSLFENQIVYLLKTILSKDFKEGVYGRKKKNMFECQLVYKGFVDFCGVVEFCIEDFENDVNLMYKVYSSYVLYRLLTSSCIISDELFMKSIINEITTDNNQLDIKFLTDIYLLLIFLMNSTSDPILIKHLNIILNCFLYLHHKNHIDTLFITHLLDIFNERLSFQESLIFNKVENEEKGKRVICSYLTSAASVKFALGLKGNLNFNVKGRGCYVLSDRISIK